MVNDSTIKNAVAKGATGVTGGGGGAGLGGGLFVGPTGAVVTLDSVNFIQDSASGGAGGSGAGGHLGGTGGFGGFVQLGNTGSLSTKTRAGAGGRGSPGGNGGTGGLGGQGGGVTGGKAGGFGQGGGGGTGGGGGGGSGRQVSGLRISAMAVAVALPDTAGSAPMGLQARPAAPAGSGPGTVAPVARATTAFKGTPVRQARQASAASS